MPSPHCLTISVRRACSVISAMGKILSPRWSGVSLVTALVSDWVVVHAVSAFDEIVPDADRAVLQLVCDRQG